MQLHEQKVTTTIGLPEPQKYVEYLPFGLFWIFGLLFLPTFRVQVHDGTEHHSVYSSCSR